MHPRKVVTLAPVRASTRPTIQAAVTSRGSWQRQDGYEQETGVAYAFGGMAGRVGLTRLKLDATLPV
ncbi:hypothetical protein [Microtetraspora malaysiensis]|uniref:Uncharacterized protein n=1 Tax=Microtetraspora malaysiensis TaxID=161358 RepID=A0ABW6T2M2_9ACTN